MKRTKWIPYFRAIAVGFGAISLSVLFFFLIYNFPNIASWVDKIMGILAPFVYGAVIAYLLRPMCNAFEDLLEKCLPQKLKKIANSVAVFLSILTGIMIVYALVIMIAPQLVQSVETIWAAIPGKVDDFILWCSTTFGADEEWIAMIENGSDQLYTYLGNWVNDTLVPSLESWLSGGSADVASGINGILDGVGTIVTGVGNSVLQIIHFVYNLIIGIIVAVYLLGSRKRFARQGVMVVHSLFKPRTAELVLDEIKLVDDMFSGFIDGKIIDSAIIGVLCYLGCLIFRFPNALLVSVIVGVTDFIPVFGPFIGGVPATLLIMIESPIKGLWFVVFIVALQQLDGNVIGPKILGDRTGLSSFWVLFAIVLFGGLWGFAGMIVGVPLMAVIYDAVRKLIHRGLNRNGKSGMMEDYAADFVPQEPAPEPPEEEDPEET